MSSCATLFTKSSQEVTFKGIPGTAIIDKDRNTPIAEVGSNGFATANVRKKLKSKNLTAQKDGYQTADYTLDTKIQGWFWGNLVLGGIPGMAIDAATGAFAEGGIAGQTRQSLLNVQAVLAAAGLTMDHVIKTTVFLNDMNDFAEMNQVYASFFEKEAPARSAVEVARLPKDAAVEIEAIAVR